MILKDWKNELKKVFPISLVIKIFLGAIILSFGIYNIHEQSSVTEGGVIGLNLLVHHWFGISVAYITPVLDITCYLLGLKYLGKRFLVVSLFSTMLYSGFYKFWELFPPIFPNLENHMLVAAILGGLFVGGGAGIIVSSGGSSGGDDALALVISKKFNFKISSAYLFTDISVLLLSLSYIPLGKIFFSLITVTISSYTIDYINSLSKQTEVSSIEA